MHSMKLAQIIRLRNIPHLILFLLNLEHFFASSVEPDQLASVEANWSGSALFAIQYLNFINNMDEVIWLAEN